MGSRPGPNISLFLIIASMAMLASSNTVPQEMPYDFPTCLEAVKGCFYEIHQFKRGFLSGVLPEPGSGLIGPACCAAIMEIHEKCWLFICPDPFFTPQLQNYCTRQSQMAPGPNPDDTPLAPAQAPDPDTPSQAPSVDPPAPAPKDDPPAPAPEDDPPAPSVDPPAPAPAPAPKDDPPAPAPKDDPPAPAPAPKDDPPAPAPAPKDDPPAPAPAPSCIPRRHHHHGGGDLSEKWFCT